MRDFFNSVQVAPAFPPKAAVSDNTAQVSLAGVTVGYSSVILAIVTGTNNDPDVTYSVLVEDSDDNVVYSTVPDVYLTGSLTLAAFDFADDNECRKIGYTGGKKYVRATITPANNSGTFFVGGIWVLTDPSRYIPLGPAAAVVVVTAAPLTADNGATSLTADDAATPLTAA